MLIGVILEILITFLGILNEIWPDWVLPDDFVAALATLLEYSYRFDGIFPIYDLLLVIVFILMFEMSIIFFRIAGGILSLIRGGGNIDI